MIDLADMAGGKSSVVGVGVAEHCWFGSGLAFCLLLAILADFLDPPLYLCLVLCCLFRGFACFASETIFLH